MIPQECFETAKRHRYVDYSKSVEADFEMIEPHLPKEVNSILDIGCGLAGIDVFLKRKYPKASLTLLDSDGSHGNAGFSAGGGAGGDRKLTQSLLEANEVKIDRWLDIGTKDCLSADLVISLLSWGFHYPLSEYSVEGLCIADIRHGHKAPKGLTISRELKYSRMMWESNCSPSSAS